MTTMQLEATSSLGDRLSDTEESRGLDVLDVVDRGLSAIEEATEEAAPRTLTIEEMWREVALSLEQAERGEFAPGTGREALYRAAQKGIARSQAKSRSQAK